MDFQKFRGDECIGIGRGFNGEPAFFRTDFVDRRPFLQAADDAVVLARPAAQVDSAGFDRFGFRIDVIGIDPDGDTGGHGDSGPLGRFARRRVAQGDLLQDGDRVALLQMAQDFADEGGLAADIDVAPLTTRWRAG